MTIAEYALRTRVSDRTVRQWRKTGRLVLEPMTGLIRPEESDRLRAATAQRIRMPKAAEPPPAPADPPRPAAAFVLEAHLVAAGIAAAAELVAEGAAVGAAVLTVQGVLFHVAHQLARVGAYPGDPLRISFTFNTDTDPALGDRVAAEGASLAAQWAAEDALTQETPHA
jgi:hypothetical protein